MMKLDIYLKDNTLIKSIQLQEFSECNDGLLEDFAFVQNYEYYFIVSTTNNQGFQLYLVDYEIELEEFNNSFRSPCKRYLINQYDRTYFSIYLLKGDNKVLYRSPYISIAIRKNFAEKVEKMLLEIENFQGGILESNTNIKSKRNSHLENDKSKDIETIIYILNESITFLKVNYNWFKNNALYKVSLKNETMPISRVSSIGISTIKNIVNNVSELQRVNCKTNIRIGNNYYIPNNVLGEINHNNYDIYENRLIIFYINSLLKFCYSEITLIDEKLEALKNETESIRNIVIPEGYQISALIHSNLIINRYNALKFRVETNYVQLNSILRDYKNLFNIIGQIDNMEVKPTHGFREINNYRIIFSIINKWFNMGNYSLIKNNFMFKLKHLSKLYEYYCLIQLINTLSNYGYELVNKEFIVYSDSYLKEDLINNKYVFINNVEQSEITIYYEPLIENKNENSNEYNLYRIDNDGAYFKPDFLIKYKNINNKNYYGIFDSKFSTIDTIKKYYLDKEIVKYIHNIGKINSNYNDILFLFLIYPLFEEQRVYTIQKNLDYEQLNIPVIGILPIAPDVGKIANEKLIHDILKIFNYISNQY